MKSFEFPIEERKQNALQWKDTWLLTMWKGDHLYPAQVINAIQTKWKVTNDKSVMTPVGRNRFVCKIHAKTKSLFGFALMALLLEHYNRITVGRVASAAGSVVLILPEDGLPKNNDGFRAKVRVDVNLPIKKRAYAESIERVIHGWLSGTQIVQLSTVRNVNELDIKNILAPSHLVKIR
ncbi:hypothetical protein FRX31_017342 [Thalictrum thalictroides]|uniref:Uncharacterized protein n=1 Tax=Thalictrum thalictroides TaxID=46969 RepID=A0A7J6W7U1_THATH|nr:hypothetical protein FRX31_017342 [Thalictrum thalictroides]